MTRPKDRIVGITKEFVGEIIGDGALAEERSRQKRDPGTTLSEKDKPEPITV